jgi:uncharacterized protein YndB with AHSA1/START domain
MNTNEAYGKFITPGEVRIVRLLPGPIERIWDYLTVPEKRARWFCGGETEQKAGRKVAFLMQHKNLSPGETPPPEYAEMQCNGVSFEGRMIRCEPPRLLVYTFGSQDSVVTFELTPQGEQVRLVLTHRAQGPETLAEISGYGAGWHTHFALLVAELEGAARPLFWATHTELKPIYMKLLTDAQQA